MDASLNKADNSELYGQCLAGADSELLSLKTR